VAASLAILKLFQSLFSKKTALTFALLFAIHPLQSEAVAYLSGRGDLMAIFFMVCGLLLFSKNIFAAVLFQILALLSKENAVVFPVFLFLYEKMRGDKINPGKHACFWILTLGYVVLRLSVLNFINTTNFYGTENILTGHLSYRVWTYLTTLTGGIRLWVLPYDLHHGRAWPIYKSFFDFPVMASAVILLGIAGWLLWRKDRKLGCGFLWFLAATLPTSNLLFVINALFYDHWFILPGIGLLITAAAFVESHPISQTRWFPWVMGGLLCILSCWTLFYNSRWVSPDQLYAYILKWEPGSEQITINAAKTLSVKGQFKESMVLLKKTIQINDRIPEAHYNLAMNYRDLGQNEEALKELEKTVQLKPDFYLAWYFQGVIHLEFKHPEQAAAALEKALALYRYDENIYLSLAQVYLFLSRFQEAVATMELGKKSLPLNPTIERGLKELRRRIPAH
jgi:Tfp pilus assembly protein PilF